MIQVEGNTMKHSELITGDCLEVMREMPEDSVDLVFGSPPYEDARTYGLVSSRVGQAWVDWMVDVYAEASRICKGLVAFVVEGRTKKFSYSATPALLMADLYRRGFNLRKPPIFHRVGIPGSGGPDWLRNDWELIVCISRPGKLPWSDNTACGHTPKWAPGGEMSNRLEDGSRRNQWGGTTGSGTNRRPNGKREKSVRPSHRTTKGKDSQGNLLSGYYSPPAIANPGNVISLNVGGGHLGSPLAHESEAPFPEALATFFVQSFCPIGGTVLDPFSGSGTTGVASVRYQRKFIGVDIRAGQNAIAKKRVDQETPMFLEVY